MTNQKGMTRKETLLVLALLIAPCLYFYTTELKGVMAEKGELSKLERDVVNNGLKVFVNQHKQSFTGAEVSPSLEKYISCKTVKHSDAPKTPKVCTVDLNVLKEHKIMSDKWSVSLMDYPDVKLQGVVTITTENNEDPVVQTEVTQLSEPSYLNSSMKTLHSRILATFKPGNPLTQPDSTK